MPAGLQNKGIPELVGIAMETLLVGNAMKLLSVVITVILFGRMIEIFYRLIKSEINHRKELRIRAADKNRKKRKTKKQPAQKAACGKDKPAQNSAKDDPLQVDLSGRDLSGQRRLLLQGRPVSGYQLSTGSGGG